MVVNAFDDDETVDNPPFRVPLISGTATDISGIAGVQYVTQHDTDPESPRRTVDSITSPNTQVTWSVANLDFPLGRTRITFFAADTRGNEGSATVFVSVRTTIPPAPVGLAFESTTYLGELLGLASRHLRLGGGTTAPSVADVAARLKQPLAGIVAPASTRRRSWRRPSLGSPWRCCAASSPPLRRRPGWSGITGSPSTRSYGCGLHRLPGLRLARGPDASTRAGSPRGSACC